MRADQLQRFIEGGRRAVSALDQAIIDLGAKAHAEGKRLADNPWQQGPREYDLWRRGYMREGMADHQEPKDGGP